jgi:putative transcriptional regulator
MMKNRLRELRHQHDISQTELAKHLGITRQTIYGIEKGNFVPSTMIALQLARYFACSVEQIFSLD